MKRKQYVRGASPELHQRAWVLRQHPTPAEAVLWAALSSKQVTGLRFRFQHPVGQCILDFYCASCRIVVEVDGAVHAARTEEDAARTALLEAYGCRVVRFSNEEVLTDLNSVLERIAVAAQEP